MPWHKERGGGSCGPDEWAVIKDDDGETEGCHPTEDAADEQIAALYASEGEASDSGRFHGVAIIEGLRTSDGRQFAGLEWRELPIPLMYQFEEPELGGHGKARLVGQIDKMERVGDEIRYAGNYDSSPDAQETRRLVAEQMSRWVSADIEPLEYEVRIEGDCDMESMDPNVLDSSDCQVVMDVTRGRVMGLTIVAFPAFPHAVIVDASHEIPARTENGRPEAIAAAGDLLIPPAEWFQKPAFTTLTHMTAEDNGRLHGYVAPWEVCHIGRQDVCLTAPHSRTDYSYYRTGETVVADGSERRTIATGVLSMGGGHAPEHLRAPDARAHYDNVTTGIADIVTGEDERGIWAAGALRPGVTPEQVRTFRGSDVSGDWRRIGGELEMIAVLTVNVAGFPIPRAFVAGGQQITLVAAGARALSRAVRERDMTSNLDAVALRVSALERALREPAREQIMARVHVPM